MEMMKNEIFLTFDFGMTERNGEGGGNVLLKDVL